LKDRSDFELENQAIDGKVLTATVDDLVSGSSLEVDWLETKGLFTCLAVILYDPTSQSAALMHVGGKTTAQGLFDSAKNISDISLENVRVFIIGGDKKVESQETVNAIELEIKKMGIGIDKIRYNVGASAPGSVAIFLKDGNICEPE
jgi:hypothetical protein